MFINHRVNESEQGNRLDLTLTFIQQELSRSAIRKLICDGKITVNDIVEYRPNYRVRSNDKLSINYTQENKNNNLIVPENIPLDIIYEDNDILVINKQIGMVVYPATGNYTGTLMNAVVNYNSNILNIGIQNRFGLIHRLDKDTSGVILIGKTNKGLWHYSKQFAERSVIKTYIAVVNGKITKNKKWTIDMPIIRNAVHRKKFVVNSTDNNAKVAITKFELIDYVKIDNKEYSLLNAYPQTGRTHQIRVHLAYMGHPILGDVIYGKKYKYPRLMLHAWKLKIKNISGEFQEFEAPIPIDFKKLYEQNKN
jgi:23S rRNA pseudouridine1911/1915/1917 synthase